MPRCEFRGSIPRDTATGERCQLLSQTPRAPCSMGGRWGCLSAVELPTGPATRRETLWLCHGLLLDLGRPCWAQAMEPPAVPRTGSWGLLYLEVNPVSFQAMSSGSPCPGVQCGAWCLLTSPAQQRGLSPPAPLLPWWLLPGRDLGGRPQSLRGLFSGVCPQASWQDGMALLGAAPFPPGNR